MLPNHLGQLSLFRTIETTWGNYWRLGFEVIPSSTIYTAAILELNRGLLGAETVCDNGQILHKCYIQVVVVHNHPSLA